jgi:hypothetical protein
VHLRPHVPRIDADDGDASLPKLRCKGLGHEVESGLAGAIDPPTWVSTEGRIAGDVDDEALRADEERKGLAEESERGEGVHLENPEEGARGCRFQRRQGRVPEVRSIVDQ